MLTAEIWLATIERVKAERVEAFEGETTKNANLALALKCRPTSCSRASFKAHQGIDTGRLLLSPPALGKISGKWVMPLSRRITTPDGSFGGLAVISTGTCASSATAS